MAEEGPEVNDMRKAIMVIMQDKSLTPQGNSVERDSMLVQCSLRGTDLLIQNTLRATEKDSNTHESFVGRIADQNGKNLISTEDLLDSSVDPPILRHASSRI